MQIISRALSWTERPLSPTLTAENLVLTVLETMTPVQVFADPRDAAAVPELFWIRQKNQE